MSKNIYNTRDYVIDKQKAQHFVQYSEGNFKTLSIYATQIINPILNSKISAKKDKEERF